jgi:transcriptional regulator with XRE-family HTH domain
MKVHEKLRVLRAMRKMSQKAVAEKLKVSTNTYGTWEAGLVSFSVANLYKIADIFGISVIEFLSFGEK